MIHAPIAADYLATFLSPLQSWLGDPTVTDVYVNAPGEVWVERNGEMPRRIAAPVLSDEWLHQLAQQIARVANQGISRAQPILSAALPCATRVQVVLPPATRGSVAMAFRRQVTAGFTLADLDAAAMFDAGSSAAPTDPDSGLAGLYAAGRTAAFLAAAVAARRTILISGGTASGKTTLMNALLGEIPLDERLVTIEDSAELRCPHGNVVGLIAARGDTGESGADADDLLRASLRLRPDRILLGELRGPEALTFLQAVNSGHPGSISTIHADSPEGAVDQLCLLAAAGPTRVEPSQLRAWIDRLVEIVVQVERTPRGRRVVAVRWKGASTSLR